MTPRNKKLPAIAKKENAEISLSFKNSIDIVKKTTDIKDTIQMPRIVRILNNISQNILPTPFYSAFYHFLFFFLTIFFYSSSLAKS